MDNSRTLKIINLFSLLIGLTAIFFLLTNGVPLIQAGWMHELGKKSRYVRLMLISVTAFASLMFFVRWKYPKLFEQLGWVRLWNGICRIPLRYSTATIFIFYVAIMTAVGFERQLALETRAFDLGIFAQAVWNTLHGDWFFSSIKENINLMGDHVSPILILTAPFYAIWPDPRMLVLLQAIAAASSFIPLALIARDKLKDRSLVLIFLIMFFFYQPMRATLHEDFHPEVLAEPFLWWAFYFLDKGKILRFLACCLIAVTGKENFTGIVFMLGFYALVFRKKQLVGLLVMTGAAALFLWETKWLVPHLSGAKYFYGGNYTRLLSDPANSIGRILLDPERWGYAFKVFMPFLYLPFFHLPTLILVFPVLFQNLLSSNGAMRSFNYHYFTGMTPFLFISTIFVLQKLSNVPNVILNEVKNLDGDPSSSAGLRMTTLLGRIRRWIPTNIKTIGFILLTVSIIRSGPAEYWFFWNIHSHRNAHTEMIRSRLAGIPKDSRVLTHNSLIPQLCSRKYVYQFNYNVEPTKADFAKRYDADTVIWDEGFWEPNTASPATTLQDLRSAGYSLMFEQDGFCILEKESLAKSR